jgi:hypothetical protein
MIVSQQGVDMKLCRQKKRRIDILLGWFQDNWADIEPILPELELVTIVQ